MKLRALQGEEEASVQMAPLIDCVFILLIFFLVTSLLQKPHKELAILVPDSGAGATAVEKPKPLVVVVTAKPPAEVGGGRSSTPRSDPFILIDDELMTKDLLERRLRQVAQETPGRQIRIDTDPQLAWRYIVPVVDLCRFHGLINLDIRVD